MEPGKTAYKNSAVKSVQNWHLTTHGKMKMELKISRTFVPLYEFVSRYSVRTYGLFHVQMSAENICFNGTETVSVTVASRELVWQVPAGRLGGRRHFNGLRPLTPGKENIWNPETQVFTRA